jgi:hypothetical protein
VRFIREPLVHFLALGALVFALHAAVSPDRESTGPKRIAVTAADIEHMKVLWSKQWQRPPTPQELRGLIDDHIRERVLYREALALGLDQNDTILRRRLAQKMDFLIADLTLPAKPAEEALRAYYRDNEERYLEPLRVSFTHVYFSPDQRGDRVRMEARAALATLRSLQADASHAAEYGDRLTLRARYDNTSIDAIARDFGKDFAAGLGQLALRRWEGPIASGYGMHLVYVSGMEAERLRSFEEARQQIQNDYLFDLRRETNDIAYRKLREGYEIVVEDGDLTQAEPSGR